jgi:hypothetical protein
MIDDLSRLSSGSFTMTVRPCSASQAADLSFSNASKSLSVASWAGSVVVLISRLKRSIFAWDIKYCMVAALN